MTKLAALIEGLHQAISNVGPILVFILLVAIACKIADSQNPCSQFSNPETWEQCSMSTIQGLEKDE